LDPAVPAANTVFPTEPIGAMRLQKIATDTGGKFFPLPDSSALQSVMNEIEMQLTCQSPPKTFTDALAQGKSKVHNVSVPKKAKSAQIAISWASPLDTFKVSGLRIVRGGKVVAKAAKVRKLKVRINDVRRRQGHAARQGQAALRGEGDADRLGPT
jgi:hypothetical protein